MQVAGDGWRVASLRRANSQTRKLALNILILAIFLVSCSPKEERLIGKWQQVDQSGKFLAFMGEQVEFREDGMFAVPGFWHGDYQLIDGQKIEISGLMANAFFEKVQYRYRLKGDLLQIIDDETAVTLKYQRIGPPSETLPPTLRPSATLIP